MDLKIAENFALPLEFVTGTEAILGRKGSGKSHTASVMAEELLAAGQQVIVIDPTDSWWGLRAKSVDVMERGTDFRGYPVAVLGGEHADVPLEANQGKEVAAALAESKASAILSVGEFDSNAAACRFIADVLNELFRLKGKHPGPVKLIIDEADAFAPQRPQGEEMKALGAMQKIIRRGRSRGIGCLMITQRPQEMAKGCLSQADMLVLMRLSHPKDIGAVEEWVRVQADEKFVDEVVEALPAMPVGAGYLWHPGQGLLTRVKFRRRHTFDSGATPKANEVRANPGSFEPVDIGALGAAIKKASDDAKANDPAELRKKIAQLEAALEEKPQNAPDQETFEMLERHCARAYMYLSGGACGKANTDPEQVISLSVDRENADMETARREGELSGYESGQRVAMKWWHDKMNPVYSAVGEALNSSREGAVILGTVPGMPPNFIDQPVALSILKAPPGIGAIVARAREMAETREHLEAKAEKMLVEQTVSSGARGLEDRIMDILARHPVDKQALAIRALSDFRGGHFRNVIGALRSAGKIEYDESGNLRRPDADKLREFPALYGPAELRNRWVGKMGGLAGRMLEELARHRKPISKKMLAEALNADAAGGHFRNCLGAVRGPGLVIGKNELSLNPLLAG